MKKKKFASLLKKSFRTVKKDNCVFFVTYDEPETYDFYDDTYLIVNGVFINECGEARKVYA